MGKTIFKPGKEEKKIAEKEKRGVTNVKAFIFISWLLETCSLAHVQTNSNAAIENYVVFYSSFSSSSFHMVRVKCCLFVALNETGT